MDFEALGFYKEYYVANKFIGKVICEKDREEVGYTGRKLEITDAMIDFGKGKKIKKGIEVVTIIYPFCGKKL